MLNKLNNNKYYPMDLFKTIDKKDIPISTRGILFLCALDFEHKKIKIIKELVYDDASEALNAYANIHNPESQLIDARTFQELIEKRKRKLEDMKDPEWINSLIDCI